MEKSQIPELCNLVFGPGEDYAAGLVMVFS
jgi:hypothetical protein